MKEAERSTEEAEKIHNLTAEIESFVKTADTDKEKLRDSPEKINGNVQVLKIEETQTETKASQPKDDITIVTTVTTTSEIKREGVSSQKLQESNKNREIREEISTISDIDSRQSPENNDYYPEERETITPDKRSNASCEKLQNLVTEIDVANNNVERCKKSPVKILIRAPTDDDSKVEEVILDDGRCDGTTTPLSTEVDLILENECKVTRNTDSIQRNAQKEEISASNAVIESTSSQPTTSVIVESNKERAAQPSSLEATTTKITTERTETVISVSSKTVNTEPVEKTSYSKSVTPEPVKVRAVYSKPSITSSKPIISNKPVLAKPIPEPVVSEPSTPEPSAELKITESTDDLTKIPPAKSSQKPTVFEVRNVPLKSLSPSMCRKEIDLQKEQKEEEEEEAVAIRNKEPTQETKPAPPQRRRSVKEIIESINKSQSLLKMNQKPTPPPKDESKYTIRNTFPLPVEEKNYSERIRSSKQPSPPRAANGNDEIDTLTANERLMKKMIADMEEDKNGNDMEEVANIPLFVERFNELNNNSSLFQKCAFKREQTPDNFLDGERSSHEWNPLPKPRRTKNTPH